MPVNFWIVFWSIRWMTEMQRGPQCGLHSDEIEREPCQSTVMLVWIFSIFRRPYNEFRLSNPTASMTSWVRLISHYVSTFLYCLPRAVVLISVTLKWLGENRHINNSSNIKQTFRSQGAIITEFNCNTQTIPKRMFWST